MSKQKNQNCFWFDFAKWTAALSMLVFFRPKIQYPFGKPEKKGKIIVSSNHIGPLDNVKIAMVFPWRRMWTLTRKECFEKPLHNWVFRSILCIPIDRENLAVDTYRDILDLLKQEKLVLFFSEGRLNFKDNQVQDYKMGTAFFAAMSGAPVVPVYIVRREKFLQRTRLIVGKELKFQEVCGPVPSLPEIEKFNEYIREQECTLEKWYHEHMGK